MRLESYGTSDAGPYRKRNEDAFLVVPEKGLFAVADGMGGHHGGDLASAKAVSSLKKLLFEDIPASDALLDKFLASKVKQINSEMYSPQAGMAHNEKMGTTLVSLWFLGGKALISNVGDSRCYHWKAVDGSLTQVTEDHNLFEQVRRVEPDVSSQQYANLSSALTKVIGINAELEPDLHLIPAAPNDVFFLCTDGISKELGFDEINSVLAEKSSASAKEIGEALMKMAADKHPKDNYTSVVVKVISLDEGAGRFSSSVTANRKNRKALYFFLFILLGVAVVAFLIW
jgi:protein phosphatase